MDMIGFESIGRRAPAEPAVMLATPTGAGEDLHAIAVREPPHRITPTVVDHHPHEPRDADDDGEGEDHRKLGAMRHGCPHPTPDRADDQASVNTRDARRVRG